ncbi:MAG: toll/interleukin-1 receptor domain-containing protein [Thiothrix sp.]
MLMQNTPQTPDIFISYRSSHFKWVEVLARNLLAQGYSVFLDKWSLVRGQDFANQLHHAARTACNAILIGTPDAVDSGWVQDEYALFRERVRHEPGFRLLPIVFGEMPELPFLNSILAIDFRDSSEHGYRRAFHELQAALNGQPPGDGVFGGALEIPADLHRVRVETVTQTEDITGQIFKALARHKPLLVLAQAGRDTGLLCEQILACAEETYGAAAVFQLSMPAVEQADEAEYYAYVSRRCGLPECHNSLDFNRALEEAIQQRGQFFLLVTRFENAHPEYRYRMAKVLRSLTEQYRRQFRLVMVGGEQLAELRYARGDMSLLNHAQEIRLPEMGLADLQHTLTSEFDDLQLDSEALQRLLALTGQHPRLIQHCLEEGIPDPQECEDVLEVSPYIVQLFSVFLSDSSKREYICELLEKEQLGRYSPWLIDDVVRGLYWSNLLTVREVEPRKRQLVWRCELIRRTGRAALGCGGNGDGWQ